MKKILLSLMFLVGINSIYAEEINLSKAATNNQPINVPYKKGDTYVIYTKPLYQTIITFGDENVQYSETGDNISFSTIDDLHSIRLKTIDENLKTDLVVKTDQDIYYFKVISTYNNYNPIINFLYPQKEITKKRNMEKQTEPVNLLKLDDFNNSYSISKKYSWTPTQIFDDGTKTYFIMPLKIQELPVFLVKTEDNSYSLVTFRVKETEGGLKIYIIDRLFKQGVLKLGEKTVIIKNKNYRY